MKVSLGQYVFTPSFKNVRITSLFNNMESKKLKFLKAATWDEVFSYWKGIEENLEHWQKYYKAKGFKSWEEWRRSTFKNLEGEKMEWKLYELGDLVAISDFHGGNFHAWSKWFYSPAGGNTFKEITRHPGIQNFKYILDLADNFPQETTLSAIQDTKGEIYIIEGMHRSCALALMVQRNQEIKSKVQIYLAKLVSEEVPKLGTGWDK